MAINYSEYADKLQADRFKNALYIGRHQIYPEENRPPHKFYYIGYKDAFGIRFCERQRRWDCQIWGLSWVTGRSNKLDKAINNAMKGKFMDCRHNTRAEKRAKLHGETFIKPTWLYKEAAPAAQKAGEKLPIRGKRRPGRGSTRSSFRWCRSLIRR